MLKGVIERPMGKVIVIGLAHAQLKCLKDGDALTVRVDDMEIPIPFRDLVITMKEDRKEPTIPPMSDRQAASTCVVLLHKQVVKQALKHNASGEICCRPLKDSIALFIISAPTDEDLESAMNGITQELGAVDVASEPRPSLN